MMTLGLRIMLKNQPKKLLFMQFPESEVLKRYHTTNSMLRLWYRLHSSYTSTKITQN